MNVYKYLGTAFFLFAVCTGCQDGTPIVLESHRVLSPDKTLEAIVERVDNGLGFGQGAVYDEVHVQRARTVVTEHGDRGDSVVFYVMEETDADLRASASWTARRRLLITYDPRRIRGRRTREIMDVTIDYSPAAQPSDKGRLPLASTADN